MYIIILLEYYDRVFEATCKYIYIYAYVYMYKYIIK